MSTEKGRYYCNHCRQKVSKTLYFTHKKLYYDATTNRWDTDAHGGSSICQQDLSQDYTFSDSDSSDIGGKRMNFCKKTSTLCMYIIQTTVSSEGDAPETDGEDGVMDFTLHEVANILHSITIPLYRMTRAQLSS